MQINRKSGKNSRFDSSGDVGFGEVAAHIGGELGDILDDSHGWQEDAAVVRTSSTQRKPEKIEDDDDENMKMKKKMKKML